jgi:hypothetical protein
MVSYLYEAMTSYGQSLDRFHRRVCAEGGLDLGREDHRRAVLEFLNGWGCRNLAIAWHRLALRELDRWYGTVREELNLLDGPASDTETRCVLVRVYDDLCARTIARRKRNGRKEDVSFGPTATSKTLFVLRPRLFPAWDAAIRDKLGYRGDGESYAQYVDHVHERIAALDRLASQSDFPLERLPKMLGRPDYTTPGQLVGEYYWITITRGVSLRSRDDLSTWLSWSAASSDRPHVG